MLGPLSPPPTRPAGTGDEGIDTYETGGLSSAGLDGPTEAYDAWDIFHDTDRLPATWPNQIGAAAGLLHPWGDGPAITTVTVRA
ncbi:hypothetical protein GA0070624_3174 [Micromonospora rhizosphaerae]|uniref:Uncharacterized protein n=1 Tax=Micromonospora rhizosphaerae TaxID=568872 RepID=A0A1C6S8G7_9ACTN|nr:hypothetical protein [Micromonospora rhizosphaerae]SCL25769.1 hypothetical protein GA0070624_3174 [Micromonospora rhizosphaerae]